MLNSDDKYDLCFFIKNLLPEFIKKDKLNAIVE
jgi:hypothetical protein